MNDVKSCNSREAWHECVEVHIQQEREALKKMSFEQFFQQRYGMTVEEFKAKHKGVSPKRKARWRELHPYDKYHYTYDESIDKAVEYVHKMYKGMVDRAFLDDTELTYQEWLECYHGHTPQSWYKMVMATGTYRDYEKSVERLKKSYEEHQLRVSNPFINKEDKENDK